MRLLVAFAFVAVASAVAEPTPVELPPSSKPIVEEARDPTPDLTVATSENVIKDVESTIRTNNEVVPEAVRVGTPTLATVETSPVKVVAPALPTKETNPSEEAAPTLPVADESVSAKDFDATADTVTVVDGPIDKEQTFQLPSIAPDMITEFNTDRVRELPLDDPEAMKKLFSDPMSLIDISPAFVSDEVMRQVNMLNMASEQDANTINVGNANPFSFHSAEPLDSVVPVMVADNPVDELDSKMDPIVVVESPSGEKAFFAEMAKVPETVKVVDSVDFEDPLDFHVPSENWRGPQLPMENWRIPVPQENWKMPPPLAVPQENWRVPPENWRGPPPMLQHYRPRPAYFRDMDMPREGAQYNMPLPAYNDPTWR